MDKVRRGAENDVVDREVVLVVWIMLLVVLDS